MAPLSDCRGVFLAVGILDPRETQRLHAEGELARGKAIGRHFHGRGRPFSLDVELQTRDGVRVTSAESVGRGPYERTKPGDTVPLNYLPSDPSVMKIGVKPQPDLVWFFMSLVLFITAGASRTLCQAQVDRGRDRLISLRTMLGAVGWYLTSMTHPLHSRNEQPRPLLWLKRSLEEMNCMADCELPVESADGHPIRKLRQYPPPRQLPAAAAASSSSSAAVRAGSNRCESWGAASSR